MVLDAVPQAGVKNREQTIIRHVKRSYELFKIKQPNWKKKKKKTSNYYFQKDFKHLWPGLYQSVKTGLLKD